MNIRTVTSTALSLLVVLCCLGAHASDREDIDALLDGLHQDATAGSFDSYFARYTADAIFMGTDKTERWTVAQFKDYARPIFDRGRGWEYTPVDRFVSGDGDLRWFDETVYNERYGHCRGTGVVVKTEAGWKIAHYSLTFLIPNAVAAEATALGLAEEARSTAP